MQEDVIGGRASFVADDGERENFHHSARPCPPPVDTPHALPVITTSQVKDSFHDFAVPLGVGNREWVQQHAAEWAPGSSLSVFENWAVPMFPLSANPATAEAVERLDMETDIRAVLPAIHVPTLLLHRPGFPIRRRSWQPIWPRRSAAQPW